MTAPADHAQLTLDEQREKFKQNAFLAMPIAGAIAWTLIGIAGALLPVEAERLLKLRHERVPAS